MNQLLYDRSTGNLSGQSLKRIYSTQLIHSLQFSPNFRFDGGQGSLAGNPKGEDETQEHIWGHQSGVNALSFEKFEGRLLLSGGADSSIKIWDLAPLCPGPKVQKLNPIGAVDRTSSAHKYGITHLSFYPFDSAAFLSSSYDHSLKLYSTETIAVSASFDLNSIIYTHALSPIASHLLVACATQHPAIRLVDLRTGSSAQSLAGHHGAVLSVQWSPTNENILASGGTDGTARLWDVRKSAGSLGLLDMEDSSGFTMEGGRRRRDTGKAHSGAVNGLSWTDDGSYIVTAGHDDKIRVWDSTTGANTLASFGPTLKNSHLSALSLLPSPTATTGPGKETLFFPNEHEILMFELHEGRLLRRLKVPGPTTAAVRSQTGNRTTRNRTTALAWRGAADGIYSGHSDGQIRAWCPRTRDDDDADTDEALWNKGEYGEDEEEKKKRQVLDDVYRDLTRQKITFG